MSFNRMISPSKSQTQEHQSIESGYHWNADVLHRSTVVGCEIVNDHCVEQIAVLVGNLQIGGSDQR